MKNNEQLMATCKNRLKKRNLFKRERPKQPIVHHKFSSLYPFQPLKKPIVHILNRFTIFTNAVSLLDQTKETVIFSIYTQRDHQTNQVSYIVIEMQQLEQINSSVLVIDLMNIPHEETIAFNVIKFLLLHVFESKNKCFIWNDDQLHDLYALVDHKYLSKIILESIQIIQLESLFKQWYNKTYPNCKECFMQGNSMDNWIFCPCLFPFYKTINDKWTVLEALWYTFNECTYTIDEKILNISRTIQCLVNHCMIITKLALVIELNWTHAQLYQFNKYHRCKFTSNFKSISFLFQ